MANLEVKALFYQTISNSIDLNNLKRVFTDAPGLDNDKKSILEQAFRDIIMDDTRDAGTVSVQVMSEHVLLAIHCAQDDICYHSLPFLLLSDVFDMITLNHCEDMFTLVEREVGTWMKPAFFSSGKILLLRMCNDLLRRLSYSLNTVFCGRIQLFLARLFPLSEKSALNLMSHFNLENLTTYNKLSKPNSGGDDKEEQEEGEEMEIEPIVEENALPSERPVDYNLYEKLWCVQDFFRNPSLCFNADRWKLFTQQVQEVLQAFSSFKLEYIETKRSTKSKAVSKTNAMDTSSLAQFTNTHYFNKYLTSEKLVNLQLSDSHFRRHILVQMLIIFQYLMGDVKFKTASQTLSDPQTTWLKESQTKVVKLIEETPPDGAGFAEYIQHALERENNWIKWKNEGCLSYEKAPAAAKTNSGKVRLGERLLENGKEEKNLGCEELSRLWNLCPDNLEACSSSERIFVPPMDVFLEDAIEEAKNKDMPKEKKMINNPNYAWQSLRLLSRDSPHFFPYSGQAQIRSLDEYLESVILASSKDMASNNNS